MKILKIIHGYPPYYNAGSEVYTQSICNELKRQHEIILFTREENPYIADHYIRTEYRDGITLYIANKAREKDGYLHPDLDAFFAQIVQSEKPDVAHIGHLNHLSTGLVAVLKKCNIPIVFTLHDFWLMCPRGQFLQINFKNPVFHQLCEGQENRKCAENCYNRFSDNSEEDMKYWTNWVAKRMAITRQIAQDVDLFIAPSRYLQQRFVKDFQIPIEKIVYLDYGFPLHYLQKPIRKERQFFTFGYIGTHIAAKGIDLLIHAFSKISVKAVLKIWGKPIGQSTDYLHQLAQKCPNEVHFCGEYVNTNLSDSVFSEVDCIVVPSIWAENSPLVIHEAHACHIPVITANFGGMAEYVQDGINGLLFEHRNPESLAEKMLFAVENPEKMQELGKKGEVENIVQHCEKLVSLYQLVKLNKA